MIRFRLLLAAGAVVAANAIAPARVQAQREAPLRGEPRQSGRGDERAGLEKQVRETLWRMTRQRVGLSDDQMRKLAPVNARFETERRELLRSERQTRIALRTAVMDSASPDQGKISQHMDRLLELQRMRVDLVAREQKELSAFMTPVQRAKYMALQEQVRRRFEQMSRGGRGGRNGPPGGARGAPGRP
jgi:hypothetical protein